MDKCTKCQQEKPLDDFPGSSSRGKKYRNRQCRDCLNASQRARYTTERARKYKAAQYARDPDFKARCNLKTLYGMTIAQYDAMLAEQNGGCAICGNIDPGNRQGAKRFHIDHDHKTREIRGLLCGNCNAGIGRFQDNPQNLLNAGAYLLREGHTGLYARVSCSWKSGKGTYTRHS